MGGLGAVELALLGGGGVLALRNALFFCTSALKNGLRVAKGSVPLRVPLAGFPVQLVVLFVGSHGGAAVSLPAATAGAKSEGSGSVGSPGWMAGILGSSALRAAD